MKKITSKGQSWLAGAVLLLFIAIAAQKVRPPQTPPLKACYFRSRPRLPFPIGRSRLGQSPFPTRIALLQKKADNHPKNADVYQKLGAACVAKKEYDQARVHYQQALTIRKYALGEYHPDIADTYHQLGEIYAKKKAYDQARVHHQQALAIRQKTLGENHPATAQSYNHLGNIAALQGKKNQARAHYQQALTILQKILGEAHPQTQELLRLLAEIENPPSA